MRTPLHSKYNRLYILAGILGVLLAICVARLYPLVRQQMGWNETAAILRALPLESIKSAEAAFKIDCRRRREPIPYALPLSELLHTTPGKNQPSSVPGGDILVFLQRDGETGVVNWITLRAPDGSTIALRTDQAICRYPGP